MSRDIRHEPRRRHAEIVVVVAVIVSALTGFASSPAANGLMRRGGTGPPGTVVVLDADSGKELWTVTPAKGRVYVRAEIGKDIVVATSEVCERSEPSGHRMEAFDAQTGDRLWVANHATGVSTSTLFWTRASTVEVAALGTVVTPGGRYGTNMEGLDAATGKQRWALTDLHELGVSGTLVFGAQSMSDGSSVLAAHDRRSGIRRWTFPTTPDPQWAGLFDVVGANGGMVVVAAGGYTGREGLDDRPEAPTTFFVLDARTGAERSRFGAADPAIVRSSFALNRGILAYVEGASDSRGGSVVGRELADGNILWEVPFDIPPGDFGPAVTIRASRDGETVFARHAGAVTAFDARSGRLRWTAEESYVLLSDEGTTLLVHSNGMEPNTLRAVTTSTGKARWHRRMSDAQLGTLYVSASHGQIALSGQCDG